MAKKQSIVTNYTDISIFSGKPAEATHHLIFGTGMRKLADEEGLFIPLTNAEHNLSPLGTINQIHGNPAAEILSKMLGQAIWERHCIATTHCGEEESRVLFRNKFGKSWL